MAQDIERLRTLLGDDREIRVVLDLVARIDETAVDLAGQRGLGKAGTDRSGDIGNRDGRVELTLAAVG